MHNQHEFCRALLRLARQDARQSRVRVPKHLRELQDDDATGLDDLLAQANEAVEGIDWEVE